MIARTVDAPRRAVAVGVVVAVTAVALAAPAVAAWRPTATATSGSLVAARYAARLEPRGADGNLAGTPRETDTRSGGGASSVVLVDVVNASEVALVLQLDLTLNAAGFSTTVEACSLPWRVTGTAANRGTACDGQRETITTTPVIDLGNSHVTWRTPLLAPGGRRHVQFTNGATLASSSTLKVAPVLVPRDRTSG